MDMYSYVYMHISMPVAIQLNVSIYTIILQVFLILI